jgi:hypothetical protein
MMDEIRRPLHRRDFLKGISLLGGWLALGAWSAKANAAGKPGSQPSFLIIMADDLGWGDIGTIRGHGQDRVRRPTVVPTKLPIASS